MTDPVAPPSSPPPQRHVTIPAVRPRVTYAILVFIIIIFVMQLITGADLWFFFGAKINEYIFLGEWWRLITATFLHADVLHIAFNAYALYIFGTQVEALFGYGRFSIVYLLSGISGSVFSFAFNPNPAVGASGAIFGLVGAMLVYLYRHRVLFGERGKRYLRDIVLVAGINLLLGLRSGIDNWGHVGGFICGIVLAWLIGPIYEVVRTSLDQAMISDTNPLNAGRWLAIFAIVLALVAGTMVAIARM